MRGSPRPEIRVGDIVIDEELRPCVVIDDSVYQSIRSVMAAGVEKSVWASDLTPVTTEEFELAIMLEVLEGK